MWMNALCLGFVLNSVRLPQGDATSGDVAYRGERHL
jgi:hypothetical protein